MTKTYKGSFIEDIMTNTYGCNADDDVALYVLFDNEHGDSKGFNTEIRAFCYSIAICNNPQGDKAVLFSNVNLGEAGSSYELHIDACYAMKGTVLCSNDSGIKYADIMNLIESNQINETNTKRLFMYLGYYSAKHDFPMAINRKKFKVSYAAACPEENEFELISEDNMEIDING